MNFKKAIKTLFHRYGVYNPSQIVGINEKKILTNIRKYKTSSPNQCEIIKKKKQETLISNFGSIGFAHQTIIEKRKQTCQRKYGVDNVMQLKRNQTKRLNTISKTFDQSETTFDK